ncbi:hypothetical protein AABH71_002110 [Salmonella enterica]|uniref:hypothetical protein n=1 Tax=Salmonella enterica TaxID=28901 RepID=UPI0012D6B48C|nr:hypothetical protein [Salmonella enterica]EBQ9001307.1 hypothetical protein [Salmonella enterica subsp. enterica serovar Blockley]ECU7993246.1 hypothetical protein [Salmonella enterica subsp. enterica serovar Toucra]ECW2125953.1 hypothetical protein [Salmonella enterica]
MDKRRYVIEVLSKKYPMTFSIIPHEVRPIADDIEVQIFKDLGTVPRPFRKGIYSAVFWYRSWPTYLISLITAYGKLDLNGHIIYRITLSEKKQARSALIQRGLWTPRLAKLYRSKIGALDATNR